MKNPYGLQKFLPLGILIATSAGLTACGGSAYQEAASLQDPLVPAPTGYIPPVAPTGTTAPTGTDLLPPYTQSFSVNGAGGVTPSYSTTVTTDNILKVKITAAPAGNNVIPDVYTNASSVYGCVQYSVTAMGQTSSTGVLSVGGGNMLCSGAPQSATIDFSGRLTAGHGPVTIEVKPTGYDFYCMQCLSNPYGPYTAYGMYSCNMYCPMHSVYRNHTVTGTMAIQVNGTSL